MKLRGRPQAPDWSRGCTLSSRTRGDTTDVHGPLQRLLEAMTRPLMTASQGRTTRAQAGAHPTRRQRETTSGGERGSAGALVQSARSSQIAIPRDFSQATAFQSGKGAGTGSVTSCEAPNCIVSAGRDLSMSVIGGGNGGTRTQANPTRTIATTMPTTERPVMASNGEVEGPGTHA